MYFLFQKIALYQQGMVNQIHTYKYKYISLDEHSLFIFHRYVHKNTRAGAKCGRQSEDVSR